MMYMYKQFVFIIIINYYGFDVTLGPKANLDLVTCLLPNPHKKIKIKTCHKRYSSQTVIGLYFINN